MLSLYRTNNRLGEMYLFLALGLFAFGLSLVRVYFSHSRLFLFLNWNLFLAVVPYLLISYISMKESLRNNKKMVIAISFIWLVLFPNTLYILTDLFHLRPRLPIPVWFDLILIFSFLWAGIVLGFKSLWDLEVLFKQWFNNYAVHVVSVILLYVTAYGIYLGRFERWNSWDIMTDPIALLSAISFHFSQPVAHREVWALTILFGTLLNTMYWTFYLIKRKKL